MSVGASGKNTSTQSDAAAGRSQAGDPTPNTEAGGTKKIYISTFQRTSECNFRLLNFVSRSRQETRKRSLAFGCNDSQLPSHGPFHRPAAVRPSVSRLSLNGNFLTRFHAPERAQTGGRPDQMAKDQSQAPIHVGASDVD